MPAPRMWLMKSSASLKSFTATSRPKAKKMQQLMIKPIHPFPARMAADFVWKKLPTSRPQLRVLDPMAGSGTTLVAARMRGHEAIGFDRDPLAVLITRAWLTNVAPDEVTAKGSEVLGKARLRALNLKIADAYPLRADGETKAFVRYWFD